MNSPTQFATLTALVLMSAAAQAQTVFPATLQGHALLPAAT